MKLANIDGRAAILRGSEGVDVEAASKGRFGPDVQSLYDDWPAFLEFAQGALPEIGEPLDETTLGSPAPAPRQVFAIGLNYRSHAEETGMDVPSFPATFTKFPASLAGPFDDVEIALDMVDWEVELVAVIGKQADRAGESEAWSHVAGLTIGQDISDRTLQFAAGAQFSLGKSRRGYGPMGPWLVTPDEVDDPDNLELGCSVNGETVNAALEEPAWITTGVCTVATVGLLLTSEIVAPADAAAVRVTVPTVFAPAEILVAVNVTVETPTTVGPDGEPELLH